MSKVRLIDANALGRYLNDCAFAEYAGVGYEREYETMCRVLKCIENAPTVDANHIADAGKKVDAVEVVRCGECKEWTQTIGDEVFSLGRCEFLGRDLVMNKGFCAWGVRKDDGDNH